MFSSLDNLFSFLFILSGGLLILYGLSFFLVPLASVIGGLLIINYGLFLRRRSSLANLFTHWFFRFK